MQTERAGVRIRRSDGREWAVDGHLLGLTELSGADAPAMEVFTEKSAVGDGDTVTACRVAAREIALKARARGAGQNALLRGRAAAFFDPQYAFDVTIAYEGTVRTARECRLKAVSIPTGSVYAPLEIAVTLLCPSGYLDGEGGMDGVDLNSVTPRLGWPLVCVQNTGMLFGVYNFDKTVTIHNRGSAPTWVRGVFTALGPGTVKNPKLLHGGAFVRVLCTMQPGDVTEIDTEKRIVRINGQNALGRIDKASAFDGMRVDPGYGVIGFDADTNPDQLSARVYFQIRYLGV